MAVTGLANLAVKVADLDERLPLLRSGRGRGRDRMLWRNGERADVFLGPVMITLFTQAIYEDDVDLPDEGFLHPALFTDDLDAQLEGHTVVWGPEVVEGTFGKRRIAFVERPRRHQARVHGADRATGRFCAQLAADFTLPLRCRNERSTYR